MNYWQARNGKRSSERPKRRCRGDLHQGQDTKDTTGSRKEKGQTTVEGYNRGMRPTAKVIKGENKLNAASSRRALAARDDSQHLFLHVSLSRVSLKTECVDIPVYCLTLSMYDIFGLPLPLFPSTFP